MTVGKGVLAVAASLGVATLVCFPEVFFGQSNASTPSTPTGLSAAYNGAIPSFVEAVNAKYPGAVPADDAAIIGYTVCQTFDADPATAYASFMAQEKAAGASVQQADFMTRTAVQTICPRQKSHMP
ncbi:DUF732 domain-containing protein [Arthrobacter sp. B1I2]|uniref:DUF732 domain-containing protein n=1 Tax=Arthrobacter sp. B1I2 TaxID=3042263 RepID=UPI002785EC41|nr:DUF732 domain-containing protein [Arthrobacter sp. B1I2]MDQ0731139.1 hypothetical protein [Arthrobacter sp. B1I2]